MPVDVPTLETDRLVMREFRGDDFEPMAGRVQGVVATAPRLGRLV
jgi:hypothetical protein